MAKVELVPLTVEQLDLLASYDLAAASRSIGLPVPPSFLDGQWIWGHFAALIRSEPDLAWWRTQYLAIDDDEPRRRIVGHFRFHYMSDPTYYPSDQTGEVHVGYSVDPIERGRGYAKAGTRELLAMAEPLQDVKSIVALINAQNAPSLAVARAVGFTADGQQPHRYGWIMERYVYPLDR